MRAPDEEQGLDASSQCYWWSGAGGVVRDLPGRPGRLPGARSSSGPGRSAAPTDVLSCVCPVSSPCVLRRRALSFPSLELKPRAQTEMAQVKAFAGDAQLTWSSLTPTR